MPAPRAEDLFRDRREEMAVPGVESRDFDSPDETRTPDKTQVAVVRMGETTAARMTFEQGWRWLARTARRRHELRPGLGGVGIAQACRHSQTPRVPPCRPCPLWPPFH